MIDPISLDLTDWSALDTPCYVFDEPELRANFADFDAALKAAWSPLARVAYSIKTNPLPWILDIAGEEGCMAEAVSGDEFALALDRGFAPSDIIFNGPAKTQDWFEYALAGGSIVNIDSVRDIAWAKQWAKTHPGQARVGIRANIELERFCPGETITGDRGGRFGFCYENGDVARVIEELRDAGVDVCGLHMHVTTLSRSQHAYAVLAEHAVKIVRENNLSLRYVDMGGGYYGGGKRNEGAYEAYAKTMSDILLEACDPATCALYVEPGGAVVCTPARYVGKVVDAKTTTANRFVTCELSRLGIDHEMKKTSHPLHVLAPDGTLKDGPNRAGTDANLDKAQPAADGSQPLDHQVLCGFTCMESDRLCELRGWPQVNVGDTVMIDFAGAYSMSFTPSFFIDHAPAVYKRDEQGVCTLIRPLEDRRAPALEP